VATVDAATGLVTGKASGTAVIKVKDPVLLVSASSTVNVLLPTTTSYLTTWLLIGESTQLKVVVTTQQNYLLSLSIPNLLWSFKSNVQQSMQ